MSKIPSRNSEEFHSMRAIPGRSIIRQDTAVPIPTGVDSPTKYSLQVPTKKMATPARNSEEFQSMRAIPGRNVIRPDTSVPVPTGYASPNRVTSAFQEKKSATPSRTSSEFESMRAIPGRPVVRSDSAVPAPSVLPVPSNQSVLVKDSETSTSERTRKEVSASRTVPVCTVIDKNSSVASTTHRSASQSPIRERKQTSPSPQRYASPLPIRSRTASPSGTIQLTPSERRCSCCSRLASQLDEFHRKPSPKKMTPPVSRSPSPAPYVVVTRDPSPAPASADRQRVVNAPTPETIPGRSGLPPFSPQRSSLRDSQRDWDDYSFNDTHSTQSTYSMPKIEVEGLPDMTVTGTAVPLKARTGPTDNAANNTTVQYDDEPERQIFTVRRNYEAPSKPTECTESLNRYHNGSAARAERHRSSPSTSVDRLGDSFDALQYTDTPVHAPPARPVIPMEPLLPARLRDPFTDFSSAEKGVWVPSSPLHGTSFNRTGCPYLTRCRTPSPSPSKSQLSIIVDVPAKKVSSAPAPVPPAVNIKPYVDNRDTDSISVATPSSKPARKSAPHDREFSTAAPASAPPASFVSQLPAQTEGPVVPITPTVGAQLDVLHKVQPHGNIQQLNLSQQAPPHAPVYSDTLLPPPTSAIPQPALQYAHQEVSQQVPLPAPVPVQPPVLQYAPSPSQPIPQPAQQPQQLQQAQYVPQTPQAPFLQEVQHVYSQHHQSGPGSVASSGSVHNVVYNTPLTAQVFSPLTQTPSVQYVQQTVHAPPSPMYYPQPMHTQQGPVASVYSAPYSQPAPQYFPPPPHYTGSAPLQPHAALSPGYVQYPPSVPYPVQYVPVPLLGVQYVQMPPAPVQYVYTPHGIDTWYTDMQRR